MTTVAQIVERLQILRKTTLQFDMHFRSKLRQKGKMVAKAAIWQLPVEILLHLLKRLHAKDIPSMRTVHPYFRDLIDNNSKIWSTASFADSWPSIANIHHFETAAEMGNIEALVKLALAYLYKEGVPGSSEGHGETYIGVKAAKLFCKIEYLSTNIEPFTWLFIRPPWSVNGTCSKECVFNYMKTHIQQKADKKIEVCVAKTMLLLEDDHETESGSAIEHLRNATQLGSTDASYLNWQLANTNKIPDRAEELDRIRQLREITRMGHIEAKLTLCKYYAYWKYGGISRIEAANFVSDFIRTVPPSNLHKSLQTTKEISSRMRYILIDWVVQIAGIKDFSSKTLHVAISIIDRYLKVHRIVRSKLQLLGVAVMVLCSRFLGRDSITIREAVWLTDNTYTYGDVVRMMGEITSTLKGNFRVPTSLDFVEVISLLGSLDNKTSCLAEYICELSLLQAEMSQYSPAEIAASAVLLTKLLVCHNGETWSNKMQEFTGYSVEDISRCAFHIHEKCFMEGSVVDHRDVTLQAVKQRYANQKFYKVSDTEIISIEELCELLGVKAHIVQGDDVTVKFRNDDELIVSHSKGKSKRTIDDNRRNNSCDISIVENSTLQNSSLQLECNKIETAFGQKYDVDYCRKTENSVGILKLMTNNNTGVNVSPLTTVNNDILLKSRDSVISVIVKKSKSVVSKSVVLSKSRNSRSSVKHMTVKNVGKRNYRN